MAFEKSHIEKQLKNIFQSLENTDIEILNLTPLSGGASAETWLFDTKCKNGTVSELILRTSMGGIAFGSGLDKVTESKVQSAAYDAGVPVAKVVYLLNEKDDIGMGYIMDRHEGETIARKILRDEKFSHARQVMAAQCGEVLAKLHAIPLDKVPQLEDQRASLQIEKMQALYKSFKEPVPVFDLAIQWLQDHCPASQSLHLVHGDFRNGNFIVDEKGLKTILDWELAHFGDPMEDLGWLCVNSWRFGVTDKPVGGFGEREDLFAAYEKHSGHKVDPEEVRFWEIFGTLKWGIICLVQTFTHLSGDVNSVERAAIGRRVSETEIDILNLLNE